MNNNNSNNSKPVVLATFNARYIHASLALRLLSENWYDANWPVRLFEGTLEDQPAAAAERILAENPALVGFSVYIWNVELTEKVVRILRRVAPNLLLVAGGPEMAADETGPGAWIQDLDGIVYGESERSLPEICAHLLANPPPAHARPVRFHPEPPELADLRLPVGSYTDEDIAHRTVAVEASRGCPMRCAFCTAAGSGVSRFPAWKVVAQLQALYDRGARFFKFLDRSIHLADYAPLLDWLLERPDTRAHFELTPHRMAPDLQERLMAFGPGRLQVEVGIQTLTPAVGKAISRPVTVWAKRMVRFLKRNTQAHVHADLIAGLPGETLETFAASFDELLSWGPDEIQVGVLKRLRGTALCQRMPAAWFEPFPPYTVLFTDTISFEEMARIRRMARYWDLVHNSGNFLKTLAPLLRGEGAFMRFLAFSEWLYRQEGKTRAIELNRMAERLHQYLVQEAGLPSESVMDALEADYARCGRTGRPAFLQNRPPRETASAGNPSDPFARQQRHHQFVVRPIPRGRARRT